MFTLHGLCWMVDVVMTTGCTMHCLRYSRKRRRSCSSREMPPIGKEHINFIRFVLKYVISNHAYWAMMCGEQQNAVYQYTVFYRLLVNYNRLIC